MIKVNAFETGNRLKIDYIPVLISNSQHFCYLPSVSHSLTYVYTYLISKPLVGRTNQLLACSYEQNIVACWVRLVAHDWHSDV